MFAELTDQLLRIHVVKAHSSMICYGTQHFFHEVRKLSLVNSAWKVRLRLYHLTICNVKHLITAISIEWIKELLSSIQVYDTSLITRCEHLVVTIERAGSYLWELLLEAVFLHYWLIQNGCQLFTLQIPYLGLSIAETSAQELRVLGEDKRVDRCVAHGILGTSGYDWIGICLKCVYFLSIGTWWEHNRTIISARCHNLIVMTPG